MLRKRNVSGLGESGPAFAVGLLSLLFPPPSLAGNLSPLHPSSSNLRVGFSLGDMGTPGGTLGQPGAAAIATLRRARAPDTTRALSFEF